MDTVKEGIVVPTRAETDAIVSRYIGGRIRHRRWTLGMTQQDLAEAVGVSFQQVQKYESGQNRVAATTLFAIAQVMDTDVNYYLPFPPKEVG